MLSEVIRSLPLVGLIPGVSVTSGGVLMDDQAYTYQGSTREGSCKAMEKTLSKESLPGAIREAVVQIPGQDSPSCCPKEVAHALPMVRPLGGFHPKETEIIRLEILIMHDAAADQQRHADDQTRHLVSASSWMGAWKTGMPSSLHREFRGLPRVILIGVPGSVRSQGLSGPVGSGILTESQEERGLRSEIARLLSITAIIQIKMSGLRSYAQGPSVRHVIEIMYFQSRSCPAQFENT